jgi:predicted ester cyclase
VDVLVIANCVALENEIFLEHVLYNNSSLLIQLGFDLEEMAVAMAGSPPEGWPRSDETWRALRRAGSPVRPIYESQPVPGFDVDRFARDTLDGLWNRADYDSLVHRYAAEFPFQGPTQRAFSGRKSYRDMLRELKTALPDLELQVDEVYWMGNEDEGYITSERWSATATHAGAGIYGEPTGHEVQIWGITQHRISDGRIVREWMLFNELDLMMQIAAARQ